MTDTSKPTQLFSDEYMVNNLVNWFKTIPDGSWGDATLPMLIKALGWSNLGPAQAPFENQLDRILQDADWKRIFRYDHNIDVRFSVLDGKIARVRFRTAFAQNNKTPKRLRNTKPRNPRFPPVGADIVTWYGPYKYKVTAKESSDGKFYADVAGTPVGYSKTLSGAARLIVKYIDGKDQPKLNGFSFFGIKPRTKTETNPDASWDDLDRDAMEASMTSGRDPATIPAAEKDTANELREARDSLPMDFPGASLPADDDDMLINDTFPVEMEATHCVSGCSSCDCCPSSSGPEKPKVVSSVKTFLDKVETSHRKPFDDFPYYPNVSKDSASPESAPHKMRPSVLWGATVTRCTGSPSWIATAAGLSALGSSPEEALLEWDCIFTTGSSRSY